MTKTDDSTKNKYRRFRRFHVNLFILLHYMWLRNFINDSCSADDDENLWPRRIRVKNRYHRGVGRVRVLLLLAVAGGETLTFYLPTDLFLSGIFIRFSLKLFGSSSSYYIHFSQCIKIYIHFSNSSAAEILDNYNGL